MLSMFYSESNIGSCDFEILLVFILLKFKKCHNISGIRVVDQTKIADEYINN